MSKEQEQFSKHVESVLQRLRVDRSTVEKKLWGAAVPICHSRYGQMSLAIIDKGGFCSKHYHEKKINTFIVDEGVLAIRIWRNKERLSADADEVRLVGEGESFTVQAGVIHEMAAVTDVICMEAYHCKPEDEVSLLDIHRFTTGGMNNEL